MVKGQHRHRDDTPHVGMFPVQGIQPVPRIGYIQLHQGGHRGMPHELVRILQARHHGIDDFRPYPRTAFPVIQRLQGSHPHPPARILEQGRQFRDHRSGRNSGAPLDGHDGQVLIGMREIPFQDIRAPAGLDLAQPEQDGMQDIRIRLPVEMFLHGLDRVPVGRRKRGVRSHFPDQRIRMLQQVDQDRHDRGTAIRQLGDGLHLDIEVAPDQAMGGGHRIQPLAGWNRQRILDFTDPALRRVIQVRVGLQVFRKPVQDRCPALRQHLDRPPGPLRMIAHQVLEIPLEPLLGQRGIQRGRQVRTRGPGFPALPRLVGPLAQGTRPGIVSHRIPGQLLQQIQGAQPDRQPGIRQAVNHQPPGIRRRREYRRPDLGTGGRNGKQAQGGHPVIGLHAAFPYPLQQEGRILRRLRGSEDFLQRRHQRAGRPVSLKPAPQPAVRLKHPEGGNPANLVLERQFRTAADIHLHPLKLPKHLENGFIGQRSLLEPETGRTVVTGKKDQDRSQADPRPAHRGFEIAAPGGNHGFPVPVRDRHRTRQPADPPRPREQGQPPPDVPAPPVSRSRHAASPC